MKEYIKNLIKKYKVFQKIYVEIKYIFSIPIYFVYKKVANPKINIDKIDKVIFIAHPDDEIVSFGNFVVNNAERLLVISFTNGGNRIRLNEFKNAMNSLNIQYQMWNFKDSLDATWNEKRVTRKVNNILSLKENWNRVMTHNPDGDYGHFQHREVSRFVRKCYKKDNLYCPIKKENLVSNANELSYINSEVKMEFFNKYYRSQRHILSLYDEYFNYEKIIEYKNY